MPELLLASRWETFCSVLHAVLMNLEIAALLVMGGILQSVSSYVNTLVIFACLSVGDSFQ